MRFPLPVLLLLPPAIAAACAQPSPPAAVPAATTASASAAPPPIATSAPTPTPTASATPPPPGPAQLAFKPVALPGASAPASLDYLAYEPAHARVWVPVGNTGSVDVYDVSAGTFTRVDGFKTAEREYKGKKRTVGPSSVAIACTDHVAVLDGAHDGARLARIDTGAGVDNIDWLAPQRLLYAAAAKAAKLTIARIDDKGQPAVVAAGETPEGARNGVADASGNAYVADPRGAHLLVVAYTP